MNPAALLNHPALGPLDRALAGFISTHGGPDPGWAAAAAAWTNRQIRLGHVCLELEQPPEPAESEAWTPPPWPDRAAWLAGLEHCPLVGQPGDAAPLILTPAGRVYLHRFFELEARLARRLRQLAQSPADPGPADKVEAVLDHLFSAAGPTPPARTILRACLGQSLVLLTGGPGTGKTTLIARLLAAETLLHPSAPGMIALAAPTGKAARRLGDSLRAARDSLGPGPAAEALPQEAVTLHRLLGASSAGRGFRHHRDRPLPHRLVVVDESSMSDLLLLGALADALPPGGRLVLAGDPDQLASVQAGGILADLVKAAQDPASLFHAIHHKLTQTHRYPANSLIHRTCEALRTGDKAAFETCLEEAATGTQDVTLLPPLSDPAGARAFADAVRDGFRPCFKADSPADALQALEGFRVLCLPRHGSTGRDRLTARCEAILSRHGLLPGMPGTPYPGLPIIITRNDYALGLFNGDGGLLVTPTAESAPEAFFASSNASIPVAALPPWEPAYVLTVHKSQGSEFSRVVAIFPEEDSSLLTREILYTALSRSRSEVRLHASAKILRTAFDRRTRRASGLAENLLQSTV